jgi:hypothetical protein
MATYLVSWDPTRWDWRSIKEQSEAVERGVPVVRQWACGNQRRIFNGDIVYFVRQGREPRGIFARGEVVRGSYEVMNVDIQDAQKSRPTLVIDIKLLELLDATHAVGIPKSKLSAGPFKKFVWDIREQGTKIPEDVVTALETAWNAAIGKKPAVAKPEPATVESAAGNAPARAAEKPSVQDTPAQSPAAIDEQERLRHEREERLQAIKAREAKRRQKPGETPAPAPKKLSEEERNEILVTNYFIMLDAELQGEMYSKADHRNRLMKELGETSDKVVDQAHRHIGAVLAETGLPFVDNYPPESGFSRSLEASVQAFIDANPELVEALWLDEVPPQGSIPVELDDARAHWAPVPDPQAFKPSRREPWHPQSVNEIDYRLRETYNSGLSAAGERFVMAFERARLREAGLKEKATEIAWLSQTYGESFGYDIKSFDDDGNERFICVKTTNYGSRFPFTLSIQELERAQQNPKRYYIYRVFQLSRGAKVFLLQASQLDLKKLEPVAFRAWP